MAKFQTIGKGMDDYLASLGNLLYRADGIGGKAVYEGAKIVADKLRSNIEALPVHTGPVKGRRDPFQVEKDGMLAGLGIAKMRNDGGFINVKIGMDGYDDHITDRYPQGHPNAMIARTINTGSTWMKRCPFINNAVTATRSAAEEKMKEVIEKGIAETMRD